MNASPRFTRQDLIREANAVRAGATGRLITDWVEIGLLDHPYKPGRGRGAGSQPGTWPAPQLKLFLALWGKKPEATIADLCNFPVYLWLFWGNEFAPLRQVRRAMNSWLTRLRHVPIRAADEAAAHILGIVEEGRPSRAKRDFLSDALRAGPPDLEQARSQLITKSHSPRTDTTPASGRTVNVDPELIMSLLTGRVTAEGQLNKLADELFEWARFFNLYAEEQYRQEQPMLAVDSRHGRLFPTRRHEHMIKYACANLLTLLGASFTVKPNPAYIASHLDPNEWKDGKVHGMIHRTDISDGGLLVEFEVIVAT
ncbi:MAG: hypothetical protein E6J20_08420 [Chloroflexi bacterium]|nr:MAG: hypothetical protein E6J20_08420 [Chloroflexota bacterium]